MNYNLLQIFILFWSFKYFYDNFNRLSFRRMLFLYILLFITMFLTKSDNLVYDFESGIEMSTNKFKFIYSSTPEIKTETPTTSTKIQEHKLISTQSVPKKKVIKTQKVQEVQQSSCKSEIKLLEKKFQNKLNYYKRKNAKYMKFLEKMYNDHQSFITSVYGHNQGPAGKPGTFEENKDKLIQCEKDGYDVIIPWQGFCSKTHSIFDNNPHSWHVPREFNRGNFVRKDGVDKRKKIIESLK